MNLKDGVQTYAQAYFAVAGLTSFNNGDGSSDPKGVGDDIVPSYLAASTNRLTRALATHWLYGAYRAATSTVGNITAPLTSCSSPSRCQSTLPLRIRGQLKRGTPQLFHCRSSTSCNGDGAGNSTGTDDKGSGLGASSANAEYKGKVGTSARSRTAADRWRDFGPEDPFFETAWYFATEGSSFVFCLRPVSVCIFVYSRVV